MKSLPCVVWQESGTPQARRYLVQPCKYVPHKRPVILNKDSGRIRLSMGTCHLEAEDRLLTLSLNAANMDGLVRP